jgi:hypothetical protein
MAGSVYGETRALAGPIAFFRTESLLDKAIGVVINGILIPAIFAVGVFPRPATFVLAIAAAWSWFAIGDCLESWAAC